MKVFYLLAGIAIIIACNSKSSSVDDQVLNQNSKTSIISDNNNDSFEYHSVTIGNQAWMAENLRVDTFRNGDRILEAKTNDEWEKAGKEGTPAWCYYDNNPDNDNKHGKLYNWYAVFDPRGLAPEGWLIPSQAEWDELNTFLGGREVAGVKLKSSSGWRQDANGSNEFGFNGFPGGYRSDLGGFHSSLGSLCYWWSSTEIDFNNSSWLRGLHYDRNEFYEGAFYKGFGIYVRCLKDK